MYVKDEKREDRNWPKDWPNGAQAITRRLNEQAAGLRAMGVEYEHDPDTATRTIYLWWRDAYGDDKPYFKNRDLMIKRFQAYRARAVGTLVEAREHEKRKAESRARGSKDTPI